MVNAYQVSHSSFHPILTAANPYASWSLTAQGAVLRQVKASPQLCVNTRWSGARTQAFCGLVSYSHWSLTPQTRTGDVTGAMFGQAQEGWDVLAKDWRIESRHIPCSSPNSELNCQEWRRPSW